ncbi:uncharacterized protein LAJ45_10630 [Morchella importuna]|uniref:uncharacterized protein n=1 Tax=Morchella importuna TaxID=1174673 RepID=UPI001E8EEC33|nr:uncharacterized protein LAJ45_10630 [Morchella importuna]KAH8145348.1 hypothetical protein LAJ45_10630 [Morchella importuna]
MGLTSITKSIVNFLTWYLPPLPAGVHSSNLRPVPSNSDLGMVREVFLSRQRDLADSPLLQAVLHLRVRLLAVRDWFYVLQECFESLKLVSQLYKLLGAVLP